MMRRTTHSGSFLLCLLLNMLLNLEWSIPAWILLGLHFWLRISIWWFVAGLAIWILRLLTGMLFIRWATGCGARTDPQKENKNPYSAANNQYRK